MKKKLAVALSATMIVSSLSLGSAFAFSDVDGSQAAAIAKLQASGIVSGVDADHFVPLGKITYAESVQLLVRAFGYNLDTMRFVQQPVASQLFTNVGDSAWYADAFIVAHYNGVDIPKDVNPNAVVTREQFAQLLDTAFERKAQLPMINIKSELKDDSAITPGYQGSVLRLVHYKVADLDKAGLFNPQRELTRGESAVWVYNALNVMANVKTPVQTEKVTFNVEKVNSEVNKVTLSREQKPTGGYAISVTNIQFKADGQAVIQYDLQDPAAGDMTTQAVTTPTAVTYVPASYEVVLEQAAQ
ncbi:S-layer homology domain-containing protein [Paenibacillus oryzisoli]|uniref:S-layer homology domain-containing protein n=1 Tax=Paenibacillus oryzisoli TaxID=1850517 RepID=UPI003D2DCD93